MLEQSVTELMDAEGLQRERAWHRMTEWCLAPNGGIVPGTAWWNCTWHRTSKWYQVQSYNLPHAPMHKKPPPGNRIKSSPRGGKESISNQN
jgi:hypothetical protein